EDPVDAEAVEVVAIHASRPVDSERQLLRRADRELHQGSSRPQAGLQRLREPRRCLDGAGARDVGPSTRQPYEADARQAAIQRGDERRRLHAAGLAPAVRLPARLVLPFVVCAIVQPAAAQTLAQRGFIDAGAVLFPQETPNDSTQLVGDLIAQEEL